ncbi:hypothetical protein [Segatella sp.]|uniref:hypothetical protein n=1 Tax=Segatella sp. TaxID=2974253 RepID=UPI003AB96461
MSKKGRTYFKIQGTYFEICALNFFFAPMRGKRSENQFSIFRTKKTIISGAFYVIFFTPCPNLEKHYRHALLQHRVNAACLARRTLQAKKPYITAKCDIFFLLLPPNNNAKP